MPSLSDPAGALGRRLANRVLEEEAWASEKLRVHAGRSFVVASGPLATTYIILGDGTLEAAPSAARTAGVRADVELQVSPLDLPTLLADPARWDTLVTSEGDPALVATLKELASTLPWFVERAFARVFGPIVGQRLADTGRRLLGFPAYASSRAADTVKSFARDEAGLLARGEARAFADESAGLTARVELLAARVERLSATPEPEAQN